MHNDNPPTESIVEKKKKMLLSLVCNKKCKDFHFEDLCGISENLV